MICSDCYDNANIYSRTREYCPYAYITEEDALDPTLPNFMVQMPKETYPARTQHETSALDNLLADRDMSVFLTNHDKISEKKISSQQINGECRLFPFVLYSLLLLAVRVLPLAFGTADFSSDRGLWSNWSAFNHPSSVYIQHPRVEEGDVKKMVFLNLWFVA